MTKFIKYLFLLIPLLFQSCINLGVGNSKFSCPIPDTMNLKCMPPSKIYMLSEKKQLYRLRKNKNKQDVEIKKKCPCFKENNNSEFEDFENFDDFNNEQPYCWCESIKKENVKKYNKNIKCKIRKNNPLKKGIVLKQDNVDFLPVLQKPKILLIWFSHWIDRDGDLHSNEYVYITVQKRYWSIGERLFNKNQLLFTPLVNPEMLNIYNTDEKEDVFTISNERDKRR